MKPDAEPFEYKKKQPLDHEKSKLSLSQIYEQEYLKQTQVICNENLWTVQLITCVDIYKPITTLQQLLTNVKDKVEPKDRQGAVYKIKCCDCPATYVGEKGRNLNTRLTEDRRATKNGDNKNNIAEHHLQTDHRIDWDSAECISFSTDYYQ